jgi:uncharacterized membrane protein YfcA
MEMSELLSTGILIVVGCIAGFINVNAGGGSTLTLPTLIFLGLDAAVANGTNRVAILIQNISAIYSFKKENFREFRISLKLSLLTLPGSIVGAILAVKVSNELFETILGIIMIGVIITMIVPKKNIKFEDVLNGKIPVSVYIAMFGIGFYGGFIQVGVGFLLMAALHYLMKLNLVYVNMHKVFIVLVYTIPALLVFILTDNIHWQYGFSLAAGNALGGWWGAKMAVKKGEKFIKIILIVAVSVMSLKLLGVF